MTDKETVKAVIYCRVDREGSVTEKDTSIHGQEKRCFAHAHANGFAIEAIFRDTGPGSKGARPGMAGMLEFLRTRDEGNFRVLITEPQRLARNTETFIELNKQIMDAGGVLEPLEPSRRELAKAPRVRLVEERERER